MEEKINLTKEVAETVKDVSTIHLKSALHLSSGNRISESADVVALCEDLVLKKGIERFVSNMNEKTKLVTFHHCGIFPEIPENLENFIVDVGIVEFLREKISPEMLVDYSVSLGLSDQQEERNSLIKSLSDEIMLGGMEEWLQQFPRKLLEEWCTDLKIDIPPRLNDNKLADLIMVRMFNLEPLQNVEVKQLKTEEPELAEPPEEPKKIAEDNEKGKKSDHKRKKEEETDEENTAQAPKKKSRGKYQCPPLSNIKLGITRDDLHNLYNVTDLQQWCKQNGISHIGKKSLVIRRILSYLETGEKPPTPKKKGKKKNKN